MGRMIGLRFLMKIKQTLWRVRSVTHVSFFTSWTELHGDNRAAGQSPVLPFD